MRMILTWIGRMALFVIACVAAVAVFAPREKVDLTARFDEAAFGDDLDAYFAEREGAFQDLVPGVAKRVIWAGEAGEQTPVSILYVHGFSATSEEIRPVPDNLANALGANLVFTRLAGHGRSGDAMAEPSAGDWMMDVAEALAAAKQVGERVVVVSTSTGGTLMAAAATRDDLMENVAGLIFVSPNFAIQNAAAAMLLKMPAVRWWGPVLVGQEREFETKNEGHAAYWTNRYPTVATVPMAALVKAVDELDLEAAKVPALFVFSEDDQVVSPQKARETAGEWGGDVTLHTVTVGEGDDPYSHVIAGDIMSPGQTEAVSTVMIDWSRGVLGQ